MFSVIDELPAMRSIVVGWVQVSIVVTPECLVIASPSVNVTDVIGTVVRCPYTGLLTAMFLL